MLRGMGARSTGAGRESVLVLGCRPPLARVPVQSRARDAGPSVLPLRSGGSMTRAIASWVLRVFAWWDRPTCRCVQCEAYRMRND